jgi:hypothetical protein
MWAKQSYLSVFLKSNIFAFLPQSILASASSDLQIHARMLYAMSRP